MDPWPTLCFLCCISLIPSHSGHQARPHSVIPSRLGIDGDEMDMSSNLGVSDYARRRQEKQWNEIHMFDCNLYITQWICLALFACLITSLTGCGVRSYLVYTTVFSWSISPRDAMPSCGMCVRLCVCRVRTFC